MEDIEIISEETPVPCHSAQFDCEHEGLKYVAGYVAHSFLLENPELGQKSCEIPAFKSTAPWITALSRGGLVVPSEQFMKQIYEMEKVFVSIHKDSISYEKNIIKKFHKILVSRFPTLPSPVLKKYARTRTFIRIRFLNCQRKVFEEERNSARKRKQLFQFQN